jgi:hypothetical protein
VKARWFLEHGPAPSITAMSTDEGDLYAVALEEFRQTFKMDDQVRRSTILKNYVVEASLEKAQASGKSTG